MDMDEELGTYKVYPETSKRIRKYFGRESQLPMYDLEEVAWTALLRFPELQKGEKISIREIRDRFRELKKAGYKVFYSDYNERRRNNKKIHDRT